MKAAFDSTGEVLAVTGGASGIGAALARGFAAAGGTAVVLDIVAPNWEAERVVHTTVDVSDRAAVMQATADMLASHGRIDALVAGAAVQPRIPVIETTEPDWRRTLAVNLDGVMWACQAVLPSMIARRKGSIVVFASGLAHWGHAEASAYAATKGALIPWAKSLAAEVAQHHVRVNTVFPGVIDTVQFRQANPSGGEREHWQRTTGIGEPQDVVGPVLFLLSDAATMTGSTLTRDRGYPKGDDRDQS